MNFQKCMMQVSHTGTEGPRNKEHFNFRVTDYD